MTRFTTLIGQPKNLENGVQEGATKRQRLLRRHVRPSLKLQSVKMMLQVNTFRPYINSRHQASIAKSHSMSRIRIITFSSPIRINMSRIRTQYNPPIPRRTQFSIEASRQTLRRQIIRRVSLARQRMIHHTRPTIRHVSLHKFSNTKQSLRPTTQQVNAFHLKDRKIDLSEAHTSYRAHTSPTLFKVAIYQMDRLAVHIRQENYPPLARRIFTQRNAERSILRQPTTHNRHIKSRGSIATPQRQFETRSRNPTPLHRVDRDDSNILMKNHRQVIHMILRAHILPAVVSRTHQKLFTPATARIQSVNMISVNPIRPLQRNVTNRVQTTP